MKKILLSLLITGGVSAGVFGITQAFFNDTETSTGNTFTAGAIDLKIDNTSYVTNSAGVLVSSPETSWQLTDLVAQKFFNFFDLKPGDRGEDTISIHVDNNDAWMCANVQITGNFDNGFSEPEDEMFGTNSDLDDGTANGDLAQELNFAFWRDDGDNIFEDDESVLVQGPASNVLNNTLALAQPLAAGSAFFGNAPLTGAQTYYMGKYWCYGALSALPVTQDNVNTSNPLLSGTGFTCNGSLVTNLSQTDQLVGDIRFYVEQARNNSEFDCSDVVFPTSSQLATPVPSPVPTASPVPTPTP